MLKKDSIVIGLLLALIFPAISMAAGYILRFNIFVTNKPSVPYLVAIALNLILMRYFTRQHRLKITRGIIITTFAFMLLVFLFILHRIR
jgi:hypothetical protein